MRIEDWKDGMQGTAIIGEFTLHIDKLGMVIRGMRICRSKSSGEPFIGMPEKSVKTPDGSYEYYKVVSFSEDAGRRFRAAVMDAVKPLLEHNKKQTPCGYKDWGAPSTQNNSNEELPF